MIYPIAGCLKETVHLICCQRGKRTFFFSFFGWIRAAALLTLCEWLMFLNNAGINVICWSVFLLEVTATEWQRARFGFAHTCPWVFSAWCWWTSTLRVKGLSYKSGTIALEVKTCTMPQTWGGGQEHGEVKGAKQARRSYLESACLGIFPAEMIFPNDLCLVTHASIKHACSLQEYGR